MIDLTQHYLFDGGMGSMLQHIGAAVGESPEHLNLHAPEVVERIHRAYAEAGADIITANTFGANRRKLGEDPAPYIAGGIALAKRAGAFTALDVGPLGSLLEPFGDMTFDEAYTMFAEIMEAGAKAGADLVLIETMSDLLEAKAALLAAKEHTELPVFVTMTFGEDGCTFLGTDPASAAVSLTALGADVVGLNCSMGPRQLRGALKEILRCTHLPVMIQPNAGLPRLVDGQTVYDVTPEEFALCAMEFLEDGAAILGGCCGTTPEHIHALRLLLEGRHPARREPDGVSRFCGWQGLAELTEISVAVVGERLNPTGRKKMRDALYTRDYDYASSVALAQQEEGADFLVVNAGLPDIDEADALPNLVLAIQKVSPLPLVIDCSNPEALDKALRVCRGRPILNSVYGNRASMDNILPLAVKYGTGLVVLALDEDGISGDPECRKTTALRIALVAEQAGVRREDIYIDCLAMAASVSQDIVMTAPKAIQLVREAGYKTILGVSNVSHGLPGRDAVNCAYLSMCLAAGLNISIINTSSPMMMDTLDAAKVLTGADIGSQNYIRHHSGIEESPAETGSADLQSLIIGGRKGETPAATEAILKENLPLDIINNIIIPALNTVGERYEQGTLFLPQLMASAEAVKAAFTVVSSHMPQGTVNKGKILLATVKGDVHDIGKNIVKMLLTNYGYDVIDLGRNVEPEAVVKAALETGAPLVGLSSLMTTTAQNIAVTIQKLRASGADCKIMVGGAVVTQEFASQIGADFYTRDAAQSAKVAAQVFGG